MLDTESKSMTLPQAVSGDGGKEERLRKMIGIGIDGNLCLPHPAYTVGDVNRGEVVRARVVST